MKRKKDQLPVLMVKRSRKPRVGGREVDATIRMTWPGCSNKLTPVRAQLKTHFWLKKKKTLNNKNSDCTGAAKKIFPLAANSNGRWAMNGEPLSSQIRHSPLGITN